jgi:hypothetical protein
MNTFRPDLARLTALADLSASRTQRERNLGHRT